MAKELFRAVQTAEEKAELILQEAQRNVRELLKTTEAEVAQQEHATALENRAMYQSILEERRLAIVAQTAERATQVRQTQQASLHQAREQLDTAARHIAERVWTDGNR